MTIQEEIKNLEDKVEKSYRNIGLNERYRYELAKLKCKLMIECQSEYHRFPSRLVPLGKKVYHTCPDCGYMSTAGYGEE